LVLAIPLLFAAWAFSQSSIISGDVVSALLLSMLAGLFLVLAAPGLIRAPSLNVLRISNLLQLFLFVEGWGCLGTALVLGVNWAVRTLAVALLAAAVAQMLLKCPRCRASLNFGKRSGNRCPACGCDLSLPQREVR
jgi:hypothetical protein